MAIQKGCKYIFRIVINEHTTLTYEGVVTSIDENFISFTDKLNKKRNFNIKAIISYEDFEDGGEYGN